eukprot:2648420-Alexandrium_andersonii.AAC.1
MIYPSPGPVARGEGRKKLPTLGRETADSYSPRAMGWCPYCPRSRLPGGSSRAAAQRAAPQQLRAVRAPLAPAPRPL